MVSRHMKNGDLNVRIRKKNC